jgi:Na+-translocating ferredoxin:NAD+ oxidoreductase RnfE subunit
MSFIQIIITLNMVIGRGEKFSRKQYILVAQRERERKYNERRGKE